MAEWLGNGLQNRVQQFESAWDLTKTHPQKVSFLFYITCDSADCAKILLPLHKERLIGNR